ncbi:hypothetical protein ACHAQH_003145 [Verticillium albo-atrum]
MDSWGITTVSADAIQDRVLTASNASQHKKKRSPSNLWGVIRNPRPHPQVQALLGAYAFHFEGDSDRLRDKLNELVTLGVPIEVDKRPLFVWEPSDMSLSALQQALPLVHVVSFESRTLLRLYGTRGVPDKSAIERHVQMILAGEVGPSGNGIILVHCETEHLTAIKGGESFWTPTFHTMGGHQHIHRTGSTSVFVGAFAVRLVQKGNVVEASLAGSVAESFAQEQIGLPNRDPCPNLSAQEDYAHASYGMPRGRAAGNEVWNLVGFEVRLRELRERMAASQRHEQGRQRRLSGETMTDDM